MMLKGELFVLGKEERIIKARKDGEEDSKYFIITVGNGMSAPFPVTCGSKAWEVQVTPDKKMMFDPYSLAFGRKYEMGFDVEVNNGFNKLKLRTWKDLGSMDGAKAK